MDYNVYFNSIDKLKAFLQKNYFLVDTAYIIFDESFSSLDLDIILWNNKLKSKLNKFIKDNNIPVNITYFTLDEFKAQFEKQLDKKFVFNIFANSWNIYGKSVTNYYFKYLKEHFADEQFSHKSWEISIKDLLYLARNASGALIYNPKLKKFLLIKHNITEDYWALPKGGVEEGELIDSTAKREIFEEVGLKKIKVLKDVNFCSFHTAYKNNIFYKAYGFYHPAVTFEKDIKISHEHSAFAWLSFDEIKEKISFPIAKYCVNKLGSWLLEKYK